MNFQDQEEPMWEYLFPNFTATI